MIFRKLLKRCHGQPGFSLVEVIAVLAISGLIGLGATTATVQIMDQGSRNADYTTASRNTMNAIYWVSRDAQMAQSVTPDVGATGFPLTLEWDEWDNTEHQAVYSIVSDTMLRSYSIDGGEPVQTTIAEYISSTSANTTCSFADRVLTIKVTAVSGEGEQAVSVSKVREITPRPGL